MAVDPALVAFDVLNTSRDTLLNYVMQNRRMQQQDRQFNTQMQLQRDRLDEDTRRFDVGTAESRDRFDKTFDDSRDRFDINTGFRTRDEDRFISAGKFDRKMFEDIFVNAQKQREAQAKYERDYNEFKDKNESRYMFALNKDNVEKNLRREFQQQYGKRPEFVVPPLPEGDFLGSPAFTNQYLQLMQNNPENLLKMMMMSMAGRGGQ